MKPKLVFLCLVWTMSSSADPVSSPEGETRCFCNEANCVRTGYMCKSTLSLCYSVLIPASPGSGPHGFRSIHGCADTLPERSRIGCVVSGNDVTVDDDDNIDREPAFSQENGQKPVCCSADMCNYIDGASVVLLSVIANNGSADKTSTGLNDDRPSVVIASNRRDLWFRVAVITVPLIGLFVLILLVMAAVRMLRGDLRRQQTIRASSAADTIAFDLSDRLVCDKSQDILGLGLGLYGDEFRSNHDYPPTLCWLEFNEKLFFGGRTCARHKCVHGTDCSRVCASERHGDIASGVHHTPLTQGILAET